jgi:hypothetical protein
MKTTKKCKICKGVSPAVEFWTLEQIGKTGWTTKQESYIKKHIPMCEKCIKAYFDKEVEKEQLNKEVKPNEIPTNI